LLTNFKRASVESDRFADIISSQLIGDIIENDSQNDGENDRQNFMGKKSSAKMIGKFDRQAKSLFIRLDVILYVISTINQSINLMVIFN
jgi:hypothetical protein